MAIFGCNRFFDGQREPPERRLQPKLAALQDNTSANFFVYPTPSRSRLIGTAMRNRLA
jgi:hypothetical protein